MIGVAGGALALEAGARRAEQDLEGAQHLPAPPAQGHDVREGVGAADLLGDDLGAPSVITRCSRSAATGPPAAPGSDSSVWASDLS